MPVETIIGFIWLGVIIINLILLIIALALWFIWVKWGSLR